MHTSPENKGLDLKPWDEKFVRLDPGTLCELASVQYISDTFECSELLILNLLGGVPLGNKAPCGSDMPSNCSTSKRCFYFDLFCILQTLIVVVQEKVPLRFDALSIFCTTSIPKMMV